MNNFVLAITGSSGRLGSAFAREAVSRGYKVFLGDIDEAKSLELVKELGEENSCFMYLDVTNINSIRNFIEACIKTFGSLDSAVHSAYPRSSQWGTPFGQLKEEGLKIDLYSQLGGAILFSQEIIENFKKQGFGNLVLISSVQGLGAPKFKHYEGTKMTSPIEYTAVKSGIISITKYLAKSFPGQQIRVNCISPGGIEDGQPEFFIKNYKNDCLNKGLLDSKDITGALMFLFSEDSRFINGQNIVVDDGWSL